MTTCMPRTSDTSRTSRFSKNRTSGRSRRHLFVPVGADICKGICQAGILCIKGDSPYPKTRRESSGGILNEIKKARFTADLIMRFC
jgi:hypothetical protein